MKAWEEHAADLYLLLNDILENQYAQRHGYKSTFYYVFNPHLPYLKASSNYVSQLMLLRQLADKDALSFEIKDMPHDLPESCVGINAQLYAGQTIKLTVKPDKFDETFKELKRYGQRAATKRTHITKSAKFDPSNGTLAVHEFTIRFQVNSSMYDLLRVILENRETRTQDWSYSEMSHELSKPDDADGDTFVRNTGNNVNKRISKETNGAIPRLLHVTTKSVRLYDQFV